MEVRAIMSIYHTAVFGILKMTFRRTTKTDFLLSLAFFTVHTPEFQVKQSPLRFSIFLLLPITSFIHYYRLAQSQYMHGTFTVGIMADHSVSHSLGHVGRFRLSGTILMRQGRTLYRCEAGFEPSNLPVSDLGSDL